MEVAATTDNLVKSYFERADLPDDMAVDLQTAHMIMTEQIDSDFDLHPQLTFSIDSLLNKLLVEDLIVTLPLKKKNIVINDTNSNQDKEILRRILWSRGCQIILENTLNNPDKVKISSTEWNSDTRSFPANHQITSIHAGLGTVLQYQALECIPISCWSSTND